MTTTFDTVAPASTVTTAASATLVVGRRGTGARARRRHGTTASIARGGSRSRSSWRGQLGNDSIGKSFV
uniref:Uncharacterized protein n=1 Tax=Hyaloperonospora arabidopsidis (strain Emoy2) TaxID=559515 RepID=M4BJ79_HYAAE